MSKKRTLRKSARLVSAEEYDKLKRENVILWTAILEFGRIADANYAVLPEVTRRIVSGVIEEKAKL